MLVSDEDIAYHLGKVQSPFVLELLGQLRDTRAALVRTARRKLVDGTYCWCGKPYSTARHHPPCLAARAMIPESEE